MPSAMVFFNCMPYCFNARSCMHEARHRYVLKVPDHEQIVVCPHANFIPAVGTIIGVEWNDYHYHYRYVPRPHFFVSQCGIRALSNSVRHVFTVIYQSKKRGGIDV